MRPTSMSKFSSPPPYLEIGDGELEGRITNWNGHKEDFVQSNKVPSLSKFTRVQVPKRAADSAGNTPRNVGSWRNSSNSNPETYSQRRRRSRCKHTVKPTTTPSSTRATSTPSTAAEPFWKTAGKSVGLGLGIVVGTPIALGLGVAGAGIFAAGATLYGAGKVVTGVGSLLTGGVFDEIENGGDDDDEQGQEEEEEQGSLDEGLETEEEEWDGEPDLNVREDWPWEVEAGPAEYDYTSDID